jgi:UDP-N-acetyl-D-mannosaminuronate dehydrogenase
MELDPVAVVGLGYVGVPIDPMEISTAAPTTTS